MSVKINKSTLGHVIYCLKWLWFLYKWVKTKGVLEHQRVKVYYILKGIIHPQKKFFSINKDFSINKTEIFSWNYCSWLGFHSCCGWTFWVNYSFSLPFLYIGMCPFNLKCHCNNSLYTKKSFMYLVQESFDVVIITTYSKSYSTAQKYLLLSL